LSQTLKLFPYTTLFRSALALQVGIHVRQLALTLDALGLRQHGSVLVEFLRFGAQTVGQGLQFVIALLELGFDLGLRLLRGLRVRSEEHTSELQSRENIV